MFESVGSTFSLAVLHLALSLIEDVVNAVPEAPLDSFPLESTFFVLPDVIQPANKTIPSESTSAPLSKVIRTLNSTPSALIRNIYDTLRVITGGNDAPHLTDLFLSVDHELCVLHNPMASKDLQGVEKTMESPEHDLQQPVDNLHDLYKIIQRPVTPHGQFALSESQVFQNDALDLQSLLLFFNCNEEIPSNELLFLFHDEHEWYHRLVLPLKGEEGKAVVMPALYE